MSDARPAPDTDRLRRVNALLEAALALPEAERDAWLATLPAAQQDLVPTLRAMLARAGVETDHFLNRPIVLPSALPSLLADGLPGGDPEAPADRAGDTVGPWRLQRELGRGGMGTVWLAERHDGGLQRPVALKLPRAGWGPGLAQRMARERDILASLEHPRIARLYDAGLSADGRPWLAMEFVAGRPIDEHCRSAALSVHDRLRLFLRVAEAVAYAHGRLVVHRDLKPGNVLVTPDGDVRLLDFGVAKLLHDDAPAGHDLTQLVGRAITPDYASPEQVAGRPVGVASDVYSLGVVLYELLTGQRPYRLRRESTAALEEAILEADVPPASRVAPDRATARALRGDLDNILAKALRKPPEKRYASVEAFADDVVRHLEHLPVRARTPSFAYRSSRLLRRHAWPIAGAAALALAVLAGAGSALWQAREAGHQRDRALQRLARNDAVAEFLQLMFTRAAPAEEGAAIRRMLANSEGVVDKGFSSNPENQAAVLLMLAYNHRAMAEDGRAVGLLRRAAALLGPGSDRDLQAQVACELSAALSNSGQLDEAIRLVEPWLAAADLEPGIAATCLHRRAEHALDLRDTNAALAFSERALARIAQGRDVSPVREAVVVAGHASIVAAAGRRDEAEAGFARAVARLADSGREESLAALGVKANWAVIKGYTGDVQGAQRLNCEALATNERQTGGVPAVALLVKCAAATERMGDTATALALFDRALVQMGREDDPYWRLQALVGQAAAWLQRGDLARARAAVEQADATIARAGFAPQHAAVQTRRLVAARVALAAGQPADAKPQLDRVIAAYEAGGTRHGPLVDALRLRAEAAGALGDGETADADLRAALTLAESLRGTRPHSFHSGGVLLQRARHEQQAGHAAAARTAAAAALEHLRGSAGAAHAATRQAQRLVLELASGG